MVHRVAVIGAGPAGLTCVKACLDEGLVPTGFESSDDMGGLWKFKEVSEPNRASIYRSLTINISKEMMCYSDFPIPADYPNYMHHSKILTYFRMYADHFKLLKHIRFQTTVKSVKPRPDFARSGQWEVVTEDKDGQQQSQVFDAVICCSGHYTYPNIPFKDFPGIETFEGKYLHSWDYKGPEDFYGKRVVVIGIGNSGGDIAVETSRVADQVYMSTRRGAWIIRQVSDFGVPVDMKYNTRFVHILFQLFPMSFFNWFGEKKLNAMYDHTMYAIKPKHRLFSQIPVINDDLPMKILSGAVTIKPNVKEICGSTVVFDDGTVVEKVDTIVFATGYNYDWPYLPNNVMYKSGHRVGLYKHVFPPNMEHPTLAVVGFIHALGAIMPQAELQARWVTRVLKGYKKLPSSQTMIKAIERDTHDISKSYIVSKLTPLQVDFVSYMDEVAGEIGVRPNLLWLLFTDYPLFKKVLWGPVSSYQYRLQGPGKWDGARRAIFTQFDRMYQPLKTRKLDEPESSITGRLLKLSLIVMAGGAAIYHIHVRNPTAIPNFLSHLRPQTRINI
ncbi:flavin-containing monooxygenase 5-like isoform X1 [Genypterus blacodes]|uniref:flavin-containing monooxygenase 5-like isoform X1 n=1 Tax=Genypterus blacodes TaxID=154954 RepID=UPI003F75AD99